MLHKLSKHRTKTVEIENEYIGKPFLEQGVPQGSVLGPQLFNIYVNEIPKTSIKSSVFQVANDIIIVYAHKHSDYAAEIMQDIKNLTNWYGQNQIFVKTTKTQLSCFRHPKRVHPPEFHIKMHDTSCKNCT